MTFSSKPGGWKTAAPADWVNLWSHELFCNNLKINVRPHCD